MTYAQPAVQQFAAAPAMEMFSTGTTAPMQTYAAPAQQAYADPMQQTYAAPAQTYSAPVQQTHAAPSYVPPPVQQAYAAPMQGMLGNKPSVEFMYLEQDEARTDLEGLVKLLTELRTHGIGLREVTYCINSWNWQGIIPMKHHGFVFRTSRGDFFTLDFGRQGIMWDVMDEFPDLPDNTFYTKLYNIDMDTSAVQRYCQETPPFNYLFYDCETWAKGMLATLAVNKASEKNRRLSKESPMQETYAAPMQTYSAPVQQTGEGPAATQERRKVSKKKAKKGCC